MTNAIETQALTKRFPRRNAALGVPLPFAAEHGTLAVDEVTFSVGRGEVFGLVGPNGAGKTTLVKMLATLILPTAGSAQVSGYALRGENERAIKASIGLVSGNQRSFYPRLSCRQNLRFYAGLYGLSPSQVERRVVDLSDLLELADVLEKRYDTCSTGMKHRLALARALVNSPELLFLDEPTRSLDPLAAARFRRALDALARHEGRTIFLVTHDLNEAIELCDRVGVMVRGKLQVVDAPGELRQLLAGSETCSLQVRGLTPRVAEALGDLDEVVALTTEAGPGELARVSLRLGDGREALPVVTRVIAEEGAAVEQVAFDPPSWEAAFQGLDSPPEATAGSGPAVVARAETEGAASSPATEVCESTDLPASDAHEAGRRLFRKPLLFLRRDLTSQMSYRLSFLLQVLGILFASASFYFVAQLVGPGAVPQLNRYGGDYFSFVLIGIAFVGYQSVALHAFATVIQSGQRDGTLEAMLATPTRLSTILFSSSLWNFAFTSLRVVIYLLIGVILLGANLGRANVGAALVILPLTIVALSGIGILSACFIMVFKRGSPINFLIGGLSSLLAGVYYPVDVLPGYLQAVARLVPLTYSLEAMRRALLAGEGLWELGGTVAALAGFGVILLPLSLVAFRFAVRQAKRDGSLTHY